MRFLIILYLIFVFLKSWYYGLFEMKENKNKTAAIAIFALAICGFVFPIIVLILN